MKKSSMSPQAAALITTGVGAGILFALLHYGSKEYEESKARLNDIRKREILARQLEAATREERLNELRSSTAARLNAGLMERGIVPTQGSRSALAFYTTRAAVR